VKHLSGVQPEGRLLASPTNIRLGWKGLLETNTLAYYKNPQIIAIKSFIFRFLNDFFAEFGWRRAPGVQQFGLPLGERPFF
jgi:hypothetical protein